MYFSLAFGLYGLNSLSPPEGFFAGAAFFATGFFAGAAFFATGFFAGAAFFATGFFAGAAFFATGFFAGAAFFATGFFAGAAFFATGLFITFLAAAIAFSIKDFFSAIFYPKLNNSKAGSLHFL